MPEASEWGGLSGLGGGALAGGLIAGGLTGGLGWGAGALLGAGIGSSAGGLLGGIFGRKKARVPDISAELAQIRGLFASAREEAFKAIDVQGQQARGLAASNLAGRGVLRSGVSESTFGELSRGVTQAKGQAAGQLAGQEANAIASVLQSLIGQRMQVEQLNQQRSAALAGQFGSLGSTLLLAGLAGMKAPQSGGTAPAGAKSGIFQPGTFVPGQGGAQPPFLFSQPNVGVSPYLQNAPVFPGLFARPLP